MTPGFSTSPQWTQSGAGAPRAARERRRRLRSRGSCRHSAERIEPCTSTTSRLPARECSVSMFCVTTACTRPRRSSSASATCAAFGCGVEQDVDPLRGRSSTRARDRGGRPGSRRPRTGRPRPRFPMPSGSPGCRSPSRCPAPVSTTHGCRSRMSAASAAADTRRILGLRHVDGFSFSTEVTDPLRGDGRAGHRASRVVPRLARGRPRRVPRALRGGYQAIRDSGIEALTTEVHLRYHRAAYFDERLTRLDTLRRRARRALPLRVPRRAGRRARRRRLHESRRRSTARPTARRACPSGWRDAIATAESRPGPAAELGRFGRLVSRRRSGTRRSGFFAAPGFGGRLRPDADDAVSPTRTTCSRSPSGSARPVRCVDRRA